MAEATPTRVFVYGTLKRGFPNHPLLVACACPFVGAASTTAPASLVIGPYSGTHIGAYERRPITVVADGSGEVVEAEAYFAHPSYAEALWRRCGGEAAEIGEYTAEHAARYVPINERATGAAGLMEAVHRFLATAPDS
ncbi:putative gamma-glutamylcyclotransferase [Panicum miliaceum]|uniref:Gamma-glutamylcyclotransferase family protein n=1 Tax=Panicum miliaceum TaxID=4540 RepID=A0A3L6T517_PANMI|nr:putative gamma-glutamylcyclotransferase [Panicum miliaceum]